MFCVAHAFASVHCCLVVTCWERADLLALVGDVYCISVTFPCGILGQVWYLIVSFPELYRLSYFNCGKSLRRVSRLKKSSLLCLTFIFACWVIFYAVLSSADFLFFQNKLAKIS